MEYIRLIKASDCDSCGTVVIAGWMSNGRFYCPECSRGDV